MLSATLVLAGSLVAASQPRTVTLRYRFRLGDSHTYAFDVASRTGMGAQQSFDTRVAMSFRQTVVRVAPNGTASIKGAFLSQTTTMNGRPMGAQSMAGKTFTMDLSPSGKPSNMKIPGVQTTGGVDLSGMQFGTILPEGPVRVGSHWTSSASSGNMGQMQISNTLARIYSQGGSTMADIKGLATLDMGRMMGKMLGGRGASASGMMHMTILSTMNVSRGVMETMHANGNYTMNMHMANPPQGQPSSVRMTGSQQMSMKRIN